MSDSDVIQMEELMAQKPIPVNCLDCNWIGAEHLLKNDNCPKCGSYAIEYDISE